MINLILFATTLIVSFVIVRIGAIAFELTGVEWSLAKFQALSCFTGTGFTTRESELITSNLQRRKIASFLMVLGNAGLVTLIATFANSIRPSIVGSAVLPFTDIRVSGAAAQWINLGLVALFIYIGYRIFSIKAVRLRLTALIRSRLTKGRLIRPVPFEELAMATGGYGLVSIEVKGKNALPGKLLKETNFRSMDIMVLAIDRAGAMLTNPKADEVILLGDTLFCFGRIDDIRSRLTE